MKTFVDSSAWITLSDSREERHPRAKRYYLHLIKAKAHIYTSDYVLAETYTRIRYDGGHRQALRFHNLITSAEKLGYVETVWVDQNTFHQAWEIFARYRDQLFSFVDCTSFVLAQQLHVDSVFAFDDDFAIIGFVVNP
jgi:predicted nucleic acid-binding protein